jgi:hypothetical protein
LPRRSKANMRSHTTRGAQAVIHRSVEASTVLFKELESLPHCVATTTIGETTPIGDNCPNTIAQHKSKDEADDYESDFYAGRHARPRSL